MLNRRGFTLIEMMVAIVMLAIVGMAVTKILNTMMNTSAAQVLVGANQGNMRSASLAIPLEFREIGYDTVPYPGGGITSDLIAIKANRLTFRAMRGMGTTCGTPTLTEFRVRKPTMGQRAPLITDGFLLFVDNDYNYSLDDQWVPMIVSSIANGTCGADSAYVITLSATPIVNPSGSVAMAISNYFVGGPVRWYETMEYGPYIDGSTSEVSIGARSISLGETTLKPMIGPIPDSTGFTLTYYNSAGTVLNPSSALPTDVRSIGISITGVTTDPSSLAGTAKRARSQTTVTTVVALRNALRP